MSHVGQKSRKCAMWAKNNLSHQFLQLNEVLNSFSFSSIPSILCALMIDPPAASNFSHFCAKIRTWTNYGIKSSPPIPASWTLSLLFTASSAHNNFICWLQSADSEASRLMGICREGEGGRGTGTADRFKGSAAVWQLENCDQSPGTASKTQVADWIWAQWKLLTFPHKEVRRINLRFVFMNRNIYKHYR